MFVVFYSFLVVIATLIYVKWKNAVKYWKEKGIPYEEPTFLLGNYGDYFLQKKSMPEVVKSLCEKFKNEGLIGAYFSSKPALIVQDPEIIKKVLTKDFYYFNGRELSDYTHNEPVTRNLFFTFGDRWRVLRQNFTPLFGFAKIKAMFHLVRETTVLFEQFLDQEVMASDQIEIKTLMSRFTIDSICSCAFGIESKTMDKTLTNNPFRTIADSIFMISRGRGIKRSLRSAWPSIFYDILGMKLYPENITNFFNSILLKQFSSRNNKPSQRGDFVDLVLGFKDIESMTGDSIENLKNDFKDKIKVNMKVDDELLAAMCVVIFSAGYETSASTSSFTLYELAKNMVCQELVVKEVDEYLSSHGGIVGYDCVSELPYLSSCVDEALRLYPVLGIVTRDVYHDYTLPNGVKLEKGLRVHIPVYYIQRNPKYYEDPDEFKPERFSAANKDKILPYTFMPFGEGPRICLGARFGKLVVMAGLITIFKKYRVELADDTPKSFTINPVSAITTAVETLNLKFIERNK